MLSRARGNRIFQIVVFKNVFTLSEGQDLWATRNSSIDVPLNCWILFFFFERSKVLNNDTFWTEVGDLFLKDEPIIFEFFQLFYLQNLISTISGSITV